MQAVNVPKRSVREIQLKRIVSYMLALGLGIAAFFVAVHLPLILRLVVAWIVASLSLLLRVWIVTLEGDPAQTRARANVEDPGRDVALITVFVASLFGLTSAIDLLGRTKSIAPNVTPGITITLGIVAVIMSWALIQTAMQIRYAHMYYYESGDQKPLLFPGGEDPSDIDFAYFSFVIGMTYQVSDVQITTRGMRRMVLFHGLISFAFSTTILALTINILSGLLH